MFDNSHYMAVKFFLTGFCFLSLAGIVLGMMSFMITKPNDRADYYFELAQQYQGQVASTLPEQGEKLVAESHANILRSISYVPYAEKNWVMLEKIKQDKRELAKAMNNKKFIAQNLVISFD